MKKYPIIGMFTLSLFVASHSSAFAIIDLNVNGGGQITASSSGNTSSEVEVNAGAGADGGATTSEGTADSSASVEVSQSLRISRDSLASVSETEEVSSEAVLVNSDLRAYATTALRSDENLEEINFTDYEVSVHYKERGKFLALVPITFTAKATATADGRVELDYPWYAFLTLDNQEKIKTELKVAVDNTLKARAVGSVRAEGEVENPSFTASESAEVATRMHVVLRSNLRAN